MRLVRVTHDRCGEYDGTEYFLAPESMTEDEVQVQVSAVVIEMVEDAKELKDPPEGAPRHYFSPDWDGADPAKTVQEVRADFERAKAEYLKWYDDQKGHRRSFSDRMRDRGFTALWDEGADVIKADALWGHNHGLELNYQHMELPEL